MSKKHSADFDRDLSDLPPELRWREWMKRIDPALRMSGNDLPCFEIA